MTQHLCELSEAGRLDDRPSLPTNDHGPCQGGLVRYTIHIVSQPQRRFRDGPDGKLEYTMSERWEGDISGIRCGRHLTMLVGTNLRTEELV